jgi:hypothetical protein
MWGSGSDCRGESVWHRPVPKCRIARSGRKGIRGPRSAGRESMGRRGVHERRRSQCSTVATSIWPTAVSQPGDVVLRGPIAWSCGRTRSPVIPNISAACWCEGLPFTRRCISCMTGSVRPARTGRTGMVGATSSHAGNTRAPHRHPSPSNRPEGPRSAPPLRGRRNLWRLLEPGSGLPKNAFGRS